jgi:hypothetical protein
MGLQDLAPLPWWEVGVIFLYAMGTCLLFNDALKVVLLKKLTPAPAA